MARQKKPTQIPSLDTALVLQGLLLASDELLIYKDENADYHVLASAPYDPNKEYKTIFMTWEDLPNQKSVPDQKQKTVPLAS